MCPKLCLFFSDLKKRGNNYLSLLLLSFFFLFRWFQILSCGAQKRDCKHHKLTAQTPSLIHVNPHRNPDSPKSTSLILLIIHLLLQYSLTFMFQTFPMTVLLGQRCMTDFIDKMKKYYGISNSMNHCSQLTSLWQFYNHGSGESKSKVPETVSLRN